MWAKFRFIDTFICSVIRDIFIVFILSLKFRSGLTQSKCGLAHFDTHSVYLSPDYTTTAAAVRVEG